MFIERFFNPQVSNNNEMCYYDTKKAIEHCKEHYTYIRHYSFRGEVTYFITTNFLEKD